MATLKIQRDREAFEMPSAGRGRQQHELVSELLALRWGESLTVTCRNDTEANRLRQVCARLKAAGRLFYVSRRLRREKMLRIWAMPQEGKP